MRALIASSGLLLLAGCGGSASSGPATAPSIAPSSSDMPLNGAFIGRAWISTRVGSPLGTLLIFLPNKTLLMDSCFETYRVSEWGVAGENIRWREDSVPIEASVSMPSPNELTVQIIGQDRPQLYIAASVPYVCPDMPK